MTDAANQPALFEPRPEYRADGPSTCLGLTFDSDDGRRAHFTELLRQKLLEPAFRAIEGFPIGTDEAILALSDPPYYTACPNPWLGEIMEEWRTITNYELRITNEEQGGTGAGGQGSEGSTSEEGGSGTRHSSLDTRHYHREPFAADVSEGKNDPIYNAHSYHTKVPHKAIMRYILHYTEPGDVVFDGFCGTGMTGVAAQLCGDRRAVEGLGYRVDGEGVVYDGERAVSRLGARRAVLNDLSPAATFIAYNYNTPVDVAAFEREARRILKEVEEELGWMYETWHPNCDDPNRVKGKINYTVWSDIYSCTHCNTELAIWELEKYSVDKEYTCPVCGTRQKKAELERVLELIFDQVLQEPLKTTKRKPVLISYWVGKKLYQKEPDRSDNAIVERVTAYRGSNWFPVVQMMHQTGRWGVQWRSSYHTGVTHVHHFFTNRNWHYLSAIFSQLPSAPSRLRNFLLVWFTSTFSRLHLLNRYIPQHSRHVGPLSGTLYISSLPVEISPLGFASTKLKDHSILAIPTLGSMVSTQSSSNLSLSDNSVDYIFVDPPFGSNLVYSELNFLWEAWLSVFTNATDEAIINELKHKDIFSYQRMLRASFKEFYRILIPGRWMTVEFHNSQNSVWNVIQETILGAGFIIADVRILDKQKGTTKQLTQSGTTKKDLVISAYKPNDGLEQRFLSHAGTADGAWDFVRHHLGKLPVAVEGESGLEQIAERQDYLLFDRMVAFHVQRGAAVPLSAAEFYAGLRQRFDARDGMFFLKEQIPAYEAARLRAGRPAQLTLFVSDEKSSLTWLRQQLDPALGGRPQTYQDIQPAFLRSLHQAPHEALPELRDLLRDNFLPDEDGRWHAPDPNKAEDLERLRRRALLAEFESYLSGRGRLRQFRAEAVRAGFAEAYRNKKFDDIRRVAARLPERVVQEDPDLLMYYDTAALREG